MHLRQGIKGVPPIKEGLNPATWMLEVSTPGAEQRTGVDFAEVYKGSEFAKWALLALPYLKRSHLYEILCD